ncbi:class I SAM-dependent methyltransferase [Arenibaculum pallidiluteum]|uniref:class I SAM-dependent methyltransferase n=1 Tax=Arenibaculum pallidiluteum TaxID=2812559 RepID=UPI001A971AC7|nr:methyltransferase domain-containing protein [Arenibaculum pallidiluteum]
MDTESVRNAYRRYAKIYDVVFGGVFASGRQAAVKHINKRGGLRILEVGVGTGLSLPKYRKDNRVVGIDLSRDMLEVARKRVDELKLPNVEALLEMDAENLEFPDASFDVVVAMFVMTVVPNVPRAMAELERVCKPGGDILIVNHFATTEPGLRRTIERKMAPFSKSLGWRPDFSLDSLLSSSRVQVQAIHTVPPFGLFSLLECRSPGIAGATAGGALHAPPAGP